jgi:transcription initiation factor TFIIH subunit 2
VCKKLTEMTNGQFGVATDIIHFNELLSRFISPPPDIKSTISHTTEFIYMGFPKRHFDSVPTYAYEGRDVTMTSTSFVCPRCHCRVTDIPAVCSVCSLPLNSSSHIARSHHHLFPVPNFEEITVSAPTRQQPLTLTLSRSSHSVSRTSNSIIHEDGSLSCYGCLEPILPSSPHSPGYGLKCVKCHQVFCIECDLFIHNSLHNCPGCEALVQPP